MMAMEDIDDGQGSNHRSINRVFRNTFLLSLITLPIAYSLSSYIGARRGVEGSKHLNNESERAAFDYGMSSTITTAMNNRVYFAILVASATSLISKFLAAVHAGLLGVECFNNSSSSSSSSNRKLKPKKTIISSKFYNAFIYLIVAMTICFVHDMLILIAALPTGDALLLWTLMNLRDNLLYLAVIGLHIEYGNYI